MPRCRTPLLALALALAAWPTGARAHATAPASDGLPDDFVPPVLKQTTSFDYPPALAELPEPPRGRVVVEIVIGIDGVPREPKVVESVHPEIDRLAVEAVLRLRFDPASAGGRPVEVVQQVPIPVEPPEKPWPEPEPTPKPDVAPDPSWDEPAPEPTGDDAPQPDLGPTQIFGILTEAGQRTPISGASVIVVPAEPQDEVGPVRKKTYDDRGPPAWELGTTSDAAGKFEIKGLPPDARKVRLIVLAAGYERFEAVVSVLQTGSTSVGYGLMRSAENPYRTVVQSDPIAREEVARRTITVGEITALPGTQGDALKAIQNFPGVARSPFGLGLLIVRGTGPNDSAVILGHHEIPTLFHFGGLTSVFNSDMLERIDFVPGNFDSRYGDAIGGIIEVTPRKGRRDGYHGYIDSDIFDTGALFEGPVGKGSFALAARRSYIDLILPLAIPDDAGLDFSVAPRYWDYQALFDYPVARGDLSVRVFGSDDRNKLVINSPNEDEETAGDLKDEIETINYFHRADLVYEKRQGPWRFLVTPSYRYEKIELSIFDILDFTVGTHNQSTRGEVERKFGPRHAWRVGTETTTTWFDVDVEAPPLSAAMPGAGSTSDRFTTQVRDVLFLPTLYTTLTLGLGERFTLLPGARAGYYTALDNGGFVDPRLRFAWDVGYDTTIKGGVGLYTQSPQPVEFSEEFGNPRVGLQHGIQNSLGIAQAFPYDVTFDGTAFFNYIYDQTAFSSDIVTRPDGSIGPETVANTQLGRVYGMEILLRRQSTGALFGWLAYTLSRSERREAPGEPFALFDFDQTHILTAVAVYRLPRNWQIGARFRLTSGNPYTPVISAAYDADSGGYTPIFGARNSDRIEPFHQLDLRVDKRWIWKVVSMTVYLDVQNAYNRLNPEFRFPAYDYSQEMDVPGLPIIPSVGTKLEF